MKFNTVLYHRLVGPVAQSVWRLAEDWTVRGSNPVEARFSASVQTGPGSHPASCTMSTGSFLGVKSGRGVTLTPHPLLVPRSRKSRAIPLLPLWAVRPVQCLGACTVELYLYFPYGPYGLYRSSVPVQGCTLLFYIIKLRANYVKRVDSSRNKNG